VLDPQVSHAADSDAADGVVSDFILAAAALLGLKPESEWRDDIAANFKLIAAAIASIDAVMPADDVESAMVFSA
jgi:hypothetical protein